MIPSPAVPEAPLSFERVARAQASGCAAYALMIPMFAFIGGIAGGFAGKGVALLFGAGESSEMVVILVFFVAGILGAGYWGIRDYRLRAGNRILIHEERLEVWRGKSADVHRFADLQWIEGPNLTGLTFKTGEGGTTALRAEEWPVEKIREALVLKAVPGMVRAMNARLEAGESLEFRPGNLLWLRYLVGGLCMIGVAGWLGYRWTVMTGADRNRFQLTLPVFLLLGGATSLLQAWRARGGILVERDGVRERKGKPLIPWQRLRQLTPAAGGLLLEVDDGRKIRLGLLIRNYEACLGILRTWMVTEE